MANPAKQRLEALRVGEISLVDVPANEAPFLVVKRAAEEPTMTKPADPNQPNQPQNQPANQPPGQGQGQSAPQQPPAPPAPAPAPQPNPDNTQPNTSQPVQKAETPVSEPLMKMHEAMSTAYASPNVPEHMKAHIANMHEQLREMVNNAPSAGSGPPSAPMVPNVNKAGAGLPPLSGSTGLPPLATGAGMNQAMVKQLFDQTVEKIGRKVSGARLEKLKAGLAHFLDLIRELDPDSLPELTGLPVVQAVAASGGDVEKKITELTEQNVALSKRLQELEEIRGVSKALPSNVNATPQPTQKSFWKGVL